MTRKPPCESSSLPCSFYVDVTMSCGASQVGLVGRDGSAVLRRLDPVFDPAAIQREVAAICAQVGPCAPAVLGSCELS